MDTLSGETTTFLSFSALPPRFFLSRVGSPISLSKDYVISKSISGIGNKSLVICTSVYNVHQKGIMVVICGAQTTLQGYEIKTRLDTCMFQTMLSMWCTDRTKPHQHVCSMYKVRGRHHRRNSKTGCTLLLQEM